MIVTPQNPLELSKMLGLLHTHAGVIPTPDMHVIGWSDANELKLVVGFNAWLGATCQIHVAFTPGNHFTPRAMLHEVFTHAFVKCARELVLGIVNSKNEAAVRYDEHLGFKELYRLRGLHDGGGDIIIFGMAREECRYLSEQKLKVVVQ